MLPWTGPRRRVRGAWVVRGGSVDVGAGASVGGGGAAVFVEVGSGVTVGGSSVTAAGGVVGVRVAGRASTLGVCCTVRVNVGSVRVDVGSVRVDVGSGRAVGDGW